MYKTLKTLKLSLIHIGFCQLDDQWQFDNVVSPFSRLYLITDGEGWVFHNGKKFMLKPGFLYLIPSFAYSKYHCDHFLEQYYIGFLHEMEGGLGIYDLKDFNYKVAATDIDHKLMGKLLELNPDREILQSDPKEYDNRPDLLSFNLSETDQSHRHCVESHGILLQLFSRFFKEANNKEMEKPKSYRRLASILQHIHKNLDQKLRVKDLAASVNLSPDYFSRLFLDIMGMRPIDYINNKRLERAQLLLMTSDARIGEIAENVGISSPSYFSRLFKRRFNIPPGEYRSLHWKV